MTKIAVLPDGRRLEFPDDASDDEIDAIVNEAPAEPTGGKNLTMAGLMDGSAIPQPNRNPSTSQQYAGLAQRAAVQAAPSAVLGLPALMVDANSAATNLLRKGYNAIAPKLGLEQTAYEQPFATSKAVADLGVDAADAIGLPKPQTKGQQIATNIATAGLSAFGGAGLASRAGRALASTGTTGNTAYDMTARALGDLGEQRALQAAGAVGGTMATEAGENMRLGPVATMALGVMGSLAPGGAAGIAKRAGGAGMSLARPFTQEGREIIIGDLLNRKATNPTMAQARMGASQELIPGSQPTIAQVSQDPGLIGLEKGLRNTLDAKNMTFAQRDSEQNLARQQYLDRMIMPSQPVAEGVQPQRGTLQYAQDKRASTIENNMEPAFAGGRPAEYPELQSIFGTIDRIKSNPRIGPRKDVQDALAFVEGRFNQPNVDIRNPETLYAIRKDLAYARDGKYNSDKSNLALARGELGQVIKSVDDVIDQAAPGYRRYMDLYAKRSIPLNQQEELANLKAKGQSQVSDMGTGVPVLEAGKFNAQFQKMLASGALRDTFKGDNAERNFQHLVDRIGRVARDLDRGAAVRSPTIKAAGSDTMQNQSVAMIIGQMLGNNIVDTAMGKAAQTTLKPLSWIYQLPDEAMGNMLLEVAKDPREASRLMRKASRYEIKLTAEALRKAAEKQGYGNFIYGQGQQ